MALLVKADGALSVVVPIGPEFTLEELQGFVGGYIELLKVHASVVGFEGEFDMMFCNEEGKLDGLPPNLTATAIFYGEAHGGEFEIIVGDVLLCTRGEVS